MARRKRSLRGLGSWWRDIIEDPLPPHTQELTEPEYRYNKIIHQVGLGNKWYKKAKAQSSCGAALDDYEEGVRHNYLAQKIGFTSNDPFDAETPLKELHEEKKTARSHVINVCKTGLSGLGRRSSRRR